MNGPQVTHHHYTFGSFHFDAATGELCGAARSVKLRPQASLALHLMLSRGGDVVTKDELRKALWPDKRIVLFEASIAAIIRELRRALGDDAKTPRFIETIPKRGYRFVPRCDATQPNVATAADSGIRKSSGHSTTDWFLSASAGMAMGLAMAILVLLASDTERNKFPSFTAFDSKPVTVAVLPFEDLTQRPGKGILARSVPGGLVGWLGPVAPERLRILDLTEAERKDSPRSSDEPLAQLVVRGSVRDDGDAVVISARLISGVDGGFVWGEDYRRMSTDTGLTGREVAARIAERVLSESLPQWSAGPAEGAANDAAAAAYMRGIEAMKVLSPEETMQAAEAFGEATRLDPGFAAAHARLAESLIGWSATSLASDRVELAREAALRSIELEPGSAVAHRVLGKIALYFDLDWQLAGNYLKRSVELSPADASGHHSYAGWLSARGRHDEALREIELAAALEPASVAISIDAMLIRFYARDFEETVSAARRLQQLWPDNEAPHRYIVLSRLAMGDTAGAAEEARTWLAGTTPTPAIAHRISLLADSEALDAYWAASLGEVTRRVGTNSGDRTALALLYVQLGRLDAAIGELEAALAARRFSYFLPYLGVSPAFDSLCGHPRFEQALRRLDQAALNNEPDLSRCAAAISAGSARR